MRNFLILKDSDNKYSYRIMDNETELYYSPYIYDDIFLFENKISDYLQKDLALLQINNLYGVLDCWNNEIILNIMYNDIELLELHNLYVFKTRTDYLDEHNQTDADGNLLVHSNYRLFHKTGSVVVDLDYSYIEWMGYYNSTYDYLFKVEIEEWDGFNAEYIYKVGVIDIKGKVIVAPNVKYEIDHFRVKDYVILMIETVDIANTTIITYDIYSSNGILLYENISDYYFLYSK